MRRFSLALLTVMLSSATLSAQMPRRPSAYTNNPGFWITAGVAGFQPNVVNDGVTASKWDFGNSTDFQYRGSIEKGGSNGSSFGLSGSWAHVPFVYSSTGAAPLTGGGAQCLTTLSCDAHLDMMTLVATFHSGAGIGFHQVLELNGGVVAYRNLKRDLDGAKLAPSGGNIDPLFALGYGFGYGLSDRTNLDLISDYFAFAIHERKGLSNGTSNTNRMPGLRLSLRMGFGGSTRRK
jgi:hypothetical protein